MVEAIISNKEIVNYTSAPPPGSLTVTSLSAFPSPLNSSVSFEYSGMEEVHQNERRIGMGGVSSFPKRKKDIRILHVGCGNSEVGAQLLKKGYNKIVNVDYSKVVVTKSKYFIYASIRLSFLYSVKKNRLCLTILYSVKKKYDHAYFVELNSCIQRGNLLRYSLGMRPKLQIASDGLFDDACDDFPNMIFELGDIAKGLNFADESFDLIICKKTLDIILCSPSSVATARKMIRECFRLLNKEHGVLVILSSGKPEDRAVFFEQDDWTGVMNIKLPNKDNELKRKGHQKKMVEAFVYVLYKQERR